MEIVVIVLGLFLVFPIYVVYRLAELHRDIYVLKARLDIAENKAKDVPGVFAREVLHPDEQVANGPPPIYSTAPIAVPDPAPVVAKSAEPKTPSDPRREAMHHLFPPTVTPSSPIATKPIPIPASPLAEAAGRPDVESMLGANWLAKLGVAAIAVSVAFFLQYAFRNGWISPTAQVGIGLFMAAVMLSIGQVLLAKEQYRSYAQVLSSGGIIVYFLSIYASFAFYHPRLLGFGPAFGAFAIGALAASVLALKNDTEVVALICILGAFATPVLIQESGAHSAGSMLRLYMYLVGLNVWVLGLARLRKWPSLTIVSFAGTWLIFFGASPLNNSGWVTEGFAGLFLLASVYFGASALCGQQLKSESGEPSVMGYPMLTGLGLIIGGCFAFAIASSIILSGTGIFGLSDVAIAGLLLSLLLVGIAIALPKMGSFDRDIRMTFGYLAAAAFVSMMLTALGSQTVVPRNQIAMAFGFTLVNYLLFLVTALVMRQRSGEEGPPAVLVGANAIIHALMIFQVLLGVRVWGVPATTIWLPVAALTSLAAGRFALLKFPISRQLSGTLLAAGLIFPFCGWFVAEHLPSWSVIPIGIEFVILSVVWLSLRKRIAWPEFRADILATFVNAAVFFGLMAQAARVQRFSDFSFLAGCALAMAAYHAIIGWAILRKDDILHKLIYLGLSVTFVSIAIPLQLRASYITFAWAIEAAVLVWTGLRVNQKWVRVFGHVVLLTAAFRALFIDLAAPMEHFELLFNPRMLAGASVVAAAYLCAWWLWRWSERISEDEKANPSGLCIVANAFTLIFVSVDLWDYAGMRWGVIGAASAQQLALSLFWTVYALAGVIVGIWKRVRPVRLFAIGLLYLSIVKVFIFDLSNLETLYRIASFFTLGVILLLVSLLYTKFEERLKVVAPAMEIG